MIVHIKSAKIKRLFLDVYSSLPEPPTNIHEVGDETQLKGADELLGLTYECFGGKCDIYLNSKLLLEYFGDNGIRGIIAHELAHAYLGHPGSLLSTQPEMDEYLENAADDLVREWGYIVI